MKQRDLEFLFLKKKINSSSSFAEMMRLTKEIEVNEKELQRIAIRR